MIAPMQYTLGTFTRWGTSPNAVARIRIHAPKGPVRMTQRITINAITARFKNRPSTPFNLLAERDNTIVITYAAHAARTPITVSSLIVGNGSSESATITPLRIRDNANNAASPMNAFAVFAALVARMYALRSLS